MISPTELRVRNLAYAYQKAAEVLPALCISNAPMRTRILWAYQEFGRIPREGLPRRVELRIQRINADLLKEPKLRFTGETLPQANLREMHWRRRHRLAEEIISVCEDISEAYGTTNRSSEFCCGTAEGDMGTSSC